MGDTNGTPNPPEPKKRLYLLAEKLWAAGVLNDPPPQHPDAQVLDVFVHDRTTGLTERVSEVELRRLLARGQTFERLLADEPEPAPAPRRYAVRRSWKLSSQ
jgi:hypothetical protein